MAAVLPGNLSTISANSWINLNLFKKKGSRKGDYQEGKTAFPCTPWPPNFIKKRQV
jgi:hypothetical protein